MRFVFLLALSAGHERTRQCQDLWNLYFARICSISVLYGLLTMTDFSRSCKISSGDALTRAPSSGACLNLGKSHGVHHRHVFCADRSLCRDVWFGEIRRNVIAKPELALLDNGAATTMDSTNLFKTYRDRISHAAQNTMEIAMLALDILALLVVLLVITCSTRS